VKWLFVLFLFVGLHASCDKALRIVKSLPAASRLLEEVQPVRIVEERGGDFGGYWSAVGRTITVTSGQSLGGQISTIIFEMHNALASDEFETLIWRACHGELDREGYVREVERIEHRNGLRASAMLEEGITAGLFPADACLPVHQNFDDYFRYQQYAGHSQWIANAYDQMQPWRYHL
jgi:hypothetical protein